MIELVNVDTYYGKSHVLQDLNFEVKSGEIVGLLGRNGVGKTTTLRTIMGLTPPASGTIVFDGQDITGRRPNRIADMGVGYVPQDRRMFSDMSVLENLYLGFGTSELDLERIEAMFERFPQLEERKHQESSSLSGGEQQMLAIARALLRRPKLLLMDEPTEGLMPALIPEIEDLIGTVASDERQGYTILLVEQNVDLVLNVSDRVYLMEKGRIVHESTPAALREDESPLDRYLSV